MDEEKGLPKFVVARLDRADLMARRQLELARDLLSDAGIPLSGENTLAMAQILATNYRSVIAQTKD